MPLWDFKCKSCENTEEVFVKRYSLPVFCSQCGEETERLIGLSSFQLRGDGWYKDGYDGPSNKKEKVNDARD